jgi:hypothetical protein
VVPAPPDALAVQLARAVAHRGGGVDADEFAVRMLEPPSSPPVQPSEDPLMIEARKRGRRKLWEMRLAVVWGGVVVTYHGSGPFSWRVGSPGERMQRLEQAVQAERGKVPADVLELFDAAVETARASVVDQGVAERLDSRPADEGFTMPPFVDAAMADISLRGGSHDFLVVVQAAQAVFTLGGMLTYAAARITGWHDSAAKWYRVFTAAPPGSPVRRP